MMATAPATPPVTLPLLAQWAGGDLVIRDVPRDAAAREARLASAIEGASIDTRTITPGALFVPLAGSRADGHAFLEEAFRRGAGAALCARERYPEWRGREPGPLVLVDDPTIALLAIARRYRERWTGLMLCVTGSAGKTTTKDLVAAALTTAVPTLKTEGNLNNQWGVPLTLLRLKPEHGAAVVEIAMSHAGEIAGLAQVALPGAAIITNAGSAHLEGLGSLEAIAREKASLGYALRPGQPLFVGADSPLLLQALAEVKARVVTFGESAGAEVRPLSVEELGPEGIRFEVEGFPPIHLQLTGRHQVRNALAAIAVARELRLDPAAVVRALEAYRPSKGRMETRTLRGATLLVDCYNANPESTRAAIQTLEAWPGATRRIAILGDMLELGEAAPRLHRETAATARSAELWLVGAHARDAASGVSDGVPAPRIFPDLAAVREALREALGPGVVVLLKASRGVALEQVLDGIGEA